ncbi:hypothetical protein Gogos_002957 [Gossypium gossypioides]|uniref:Mitochondrial arginine transporter BAC2-like n=1 Tax=Gossypium gossypioides TaxID=34282 RepID=A0A7J9CKI4_GOSGO|nr:hypothetical protein [Gossypium gossypioides]
MDFWPEFLASSWGKEFVAGGFGGMAGIISGYPLDTLRIRQQSTDSGSALRILRRVVATEGPGALYRGMAAPLASVTFQGSADKVICALQNAMVFQIYAILSRAFDSSVSATDPPSYKGVALGGVGTGALQSFMLTPVELIKIRLQLQNTSFPGSQSVGAHTGPISAAKSILKTEGLRGIYRGFTITALRDAPSHGFYFWTYEYMREQLHPGCRKSGQETLRTMLIAGGLAGVASWVCCYPLDVVKTRLQAQSPASPQKYNGIIDCLHKSVKQEGYSVLWRGLGTAVARAFVVNGAIFSAYEIALRCLFNNGNIQTEHNLE